MDSRQKAGSRPIAAAFLTPSWPADAAANGIVTYVEAISAALRQLGHAPCILSAHTKAGITPNPAASGVYPLNQEDRPMLSRMLDAIAFRLDPLTALRRKFSRALVRAARRAMAERPVELLEMEETFGLVQLVKPRLPIPIVVRLHGPHFVNGVAAGVPNDAAFRARVRYEGVGIARADAVSAPSLDILERTRTRYRLPLSEAVVIGCPAPVIPPDRRWRLADCDRERILFVGRFDRHKGGDVTIDCFRGVARRFPNVRLWFAGRDEGLIDYEGRRWKLAHYLAERAPEVAERVDWLGSPSDSALRDLRRRAFLTIVASRYENFPMVVLEAMAHACPLAATRAGGIAEIAEDGVNCLLARPGDPEDLANTVSRLLADPELAARLGQRAGEDALRRYHPETIARQTAAFHESVLKNRSGAA